MKDYSQNFRRVFADEVYKYMMKNRKIWVLVGDLGYGVWDAVRRDFPNRFINVGAAEQALVGMGVGLALKGQVPIVYSITPFLLYRPFETIRNYVHHEKIPVKLIGSGRDKDYQIDGYSHWSTEDRQVMNIFNQIRSYWPENVTEIPKLVDMMLRDSDPFYINLRK